MTYRSRLVALTLLALSGRAAATDVALQLESVTIRRCTEDYYYYYYYGTVCDDPVPASLTPSVPQGSGTIHLDTVGVLIGGTLQLEGYALGGDSVAPWTRGVERRDAQLRDGFLALDDGWGDAELVVTSFSSQGSFSGRIVNRYSRATADAEERFEETYRFSTLPGGATACVGQRLYLDEDGDGEEDASDLAPRGATVTAFGARVDAAGRTIADFCALATDSKRACRSSDFMNDEPLRRKPRDCHYVGGETASLRCSPRELIPPVSPVPPFSGPTCQGLPVFSDSDGDGEGDVTDACPDTPSGTIVDDDGCSLGDFCALQPRAACRRADFMNDEPGRRKPRDCARAQGQCSAHMP